MTYKHVKAFQMLDNKVESFIYEFDFIDNANQLFVRMINFSNTVKENIFDYLTTDERIECCDSKTLRETVELALNKYYK